MKKALSIVALAFVLTAAAQTPYDVANQTFDRVYATRVDCDELFSGIPMLQESHREKPISFRKEQLIFSLVLIMAISCIYKGHGI
mgnify:CR=1 FL=1